jgi:hypothetical protein
LIGAGCSDLSQLEAESKNSNSNVKPPIAFSTPIMTPAPTPKPLYTLTVQDILNTKYWLLNDRPLGETFETSTSYCISWDFVHEKDYEASFLGKFILKTDGKETSHENGTYFADCSEKSVPVQLYFQDKNTYQRYLISSVSRDYGSISADVNSTSSAAATPMPAPTPVGENVYFTYYTGEQRYVQRSSSSTSWCEEQSKTLSSETVLKVVDPAGMGSLETFYGCVLEKIGNYFYCDMRTPANPYSTCTKVNSCSVYTGHIGGKSAFNKYYNIYCYPPIL